MIASYTFNRQPKAQHAYQRFIPSTQLLEEELVEPGSFTPVIMWEEDRARIKYGRWGMPAQEVAGGSDRTVAPAHNIFQRPTFSEAIRLRRCLIPVDGFSVDEMITLDTPQHEFVHQDGDMFCLAGIYAYREGAWGEEALGVAVVTSASPLNWRDFTGSMPLILSSQAAQQWLDPNTNLNQIAKLLQPVPNHALEVRTVNHGERMPAILHEQAA